MISFRHHHLLKLLRSYEKFRSPLDRLVHDYFRLHKALGSKDRKWIAKSAYGLVRWQGLWSALGARTWEECLGLFEEKSPEAYQNQEDLPLHVRCSFPKELFEKLVENFGEERAYELALTSNRSAPVTIRVNRLVGTREELQKRWGDRLSTSPCKLSDVGLVVEGRPQLLSLPEYKKGWFELQDEASQLIALMVGAKPGEEGLDYCAGSGGKTLAIGAEMQNRGQIFVYDVRPKVLYEARRRMKRAGLQNAQILQGKIPKRLQGKADWVLVDVPCSGTGRLRRSPCAKWRITDKSIAEHIRLQREIVAKAAKYLAPDGRLIYATCSLLKEENGDHLAYFEKELGLKVASEPFQSFPKDGGMDGFYGVVLTRCRTD